MSARSRLSGTRAFTTADGSTIRELAGPQPDSADAAHQSLAQASVPPGGETAEHLHPRSEEIYQFLRGGGRMRLGAEEFAVGEGDCVVIAPGTPHKLWAGERSELVLLCCCAPPYSDDDTVLTGG